jgi:hypothetical protein
MSGLEPIAVVACVAAVVSAFHAVAPPQSLMSM